MHDWKSGPLFVGKGGFSGEDEEANLLASEVRRDRRLDLSNRYFRNRDPIN